MDKIGCFFLILFDLSEVIDPDRDREQSEPASIDSLDVELPEFPSLECLDPSMESLELEEEASFNRSDGLRNPSEHEMEAWTGCGVGIVARYLLAESVESRR